MPILFIPSLLRDLTDGQEKVVVPGATVEEALDSLDARYPGVKDRLVENGRLRPGISVFIDGEQTRLRLRHPLTETSEVHFLPAIGGGC
jgi:molybdopterin synthase sulfur carrier subunit